MPTSFSCARSHQVIAPQARQAWLAKPQHSLRKTSRNAEVWSAHEKLLHPIGCVTSELRHDVGVCIHRQPDLGVAEDLHHHSCWDTLDQQQRGARMPEVVEPSLRQSSPLQKPLESVGNVRAAEWPPG